MKSSFIPTKATLELVAARVALACLGLAAVASTLPERSLDTTPVAIFFTSVAAVLGVAFIYLMGFNIWRMWREWPGYGVGNALAVFLVPFVGVIVVSIRHASQENMARAQAIKAGA